VGDFGAAVPGEPVDEGREDRLREHEAAAHQKRNWVRLTFDCNDRCIFCLDSDTHDGRMRDPDEVKAQILEGRRNGAERLILSGGEPTIHPRYVDFIRLGRAAGYARIQTVTNGRMFSYREFLTRCVDAGLGEITFSIHGADAKVHDALVGVKGAYDEEIAGLRHALDDGRPIVNIDVCVNRANVRHLPAMLEKYYAMGVREFDLLQIIPFGRAYAEGRDTLFYDLNEARPWIEKALRFSRRPDVHVWLNRFPVEHLEGYEELVQDPYKLGDEVRGRRPEFVRWIEQGEPLPCREPDRCRYCYVQRLCDRLDTELSRETTPYDSVRVVTGWEAQQPAPYGGDPASERRAQPGRRRLPVLGAEEVAPSPAWASLHERIASAGARRLWVEAPTLREAVAEIERLGLPEVELALEDPAGLVEALAGGTLAGARVVRVHAHTAAQAEAFLAVPGDFEVMVRLDRHTAPWVAGLASPPARLALRPPTHDRLTASNADDIALAPFFAGLRASIPTEDVPACILGRPPRSRAPVLDTTRRGPSGQLEIFRFARRFVLDDYRVKSLRCRECVHVETCPGLHVNYVRARGFAEMRPIRVE
jgi:MoaA/NifB/PqqE/SkfB family radical SAM enzyme